MPAPKRLGLLHGAGYVGGELIRLLAGHPYAALELVTSRTFAGAPVWEAHPGLRGQTDLAFTDPEDASPHALDGVLVAAEHGQGAHAVLGLLESGFEGVVVDLSADFRLRDAALYAAWYGTDHPVPELLDDFVYGLPERNGPYAPGTRFVANPGCFATGLALALAPLAEAAPHLKASVTALTGASGSGATPKAATHFPTRDGNVRSYRTLAHRHTPEVRQLLGPNARIDFVPASGPWTRGIWGTAYVDAGDAAMDAGPLFEAAYGAVPFVRLQAGALPELLPVVGTPFCDLGWAERDGTLVVGFALDNLLKGAASQAVQNANRLLGWPETAGLLPTTAPAVPA